MAGLGGLHRATAGQETAACRAVGVAAVARRTDREETVAPATGLLAEGLVHGVGVRRMTSDWTASPNRDTTIPTGSVCRRARWSRGSGGQVRALTYVCVPPVHYPKHRGHTTAGAMDAAAGVDAHDAPTPACKTARRAVSHKRPQPVSFLLITPLKNPEAVPTLRHASRLLHFRVTVNTHQIGTWILTGLDADFTAQALGGAVERRARRTPQTQRSIPDERRELRGRSPGLAERGGRCGTGVRHHQRNARPSRRRLRRPESGRSFRSAQSNGFTPAPRDRRRGEPSTSIEHRRRHVAILGRSTAFAKKVPGPTTRVTGNDGPELPLQRPPAARARRAA